MTAKMLVEDAGIALAPLAASTNGVGSSRGTYGSSSGAGSSSGTGSSSGSGSSTDRLMAMLWEQIEQSGLLQQLPSVLSQQASDILSPLNRLQPQQARVQSHSGFALQLFIRSEHTVSLFGLLHSLTKLHPSFVTAHPAGQQCLVPAMHLALSSLHSISKAVAQAGPQQCLEHWLQYSWNAARTTVFPAAKQLLDSSMKGRVVQVPAAAAAAAAPAAPQANLSSMTLLAAVLAAVVAAHWRQRWWQQW
jgi:hypothetical protein